MSADPFVRTRDAFDLPEGIIYLDGNSLGPLPRAARDRLRHEIDDNWGRQLIRAWNSAGWMDLPGRVGDKIARLIGAAPGTVMVTDSTSVNLFKALTAALTLAGERRVILSDTGNFPTDLYIAEGVARTIGKGHRLRLVAPAEVESALDATVAVLMLTEVDYATGRRHDLARLTALAQAQGVLTIWDLAHSAGAFPVGLAAAGADFAIGCGYKYLNGGPGAPAFIYVAPRNLAAVDPALSGWMGHDAPFAFELGYRPSASIERLRTGTPPVLSLAALDAAMEVWAGIDMQAVRQRSIELSERFIAEVEASCPMLRLASPRDPGQRGSQVSFRFEEGYAAMQALIARGVIGDFRAPDIMRFGFTPLYLRPADVTAAARHVAEVMASEDWRRPEFQRRNKVT